VSSAGIRLGVDLGTTWTAAALRRGGIVKALDLGTDAPAMPSVLAVEAGEVIAGERAERQLLADPASGLRECKRRLGDTTPMVMGGKPYGAEALMAHLLRHVVQVASEAAEGQPEEIVLTHPANWGDYKLDLIREAARLAGVGEATLLAEPVAAALHYVSLGRISPGDVVAVYDFGGGTFDATVVRCTEQGAEILGQPEGLERVGGVDLDQIVILHVDQALDGRLRELDSTDPEARRALARLRAECTEAKEALSSDTEASIPVALPGLHTEVRITRDEFEATARARIADTLGALDRTIAAAAVEPSALAGVLLVGGSSRIPIVAEEVGRRIGRPTLLDADPKLVVALGAAGGSTVMSPTKKADPADPAEGSSGSATPPPPPPGAPGAPGAPGKPGAPLSASAQAGARAAALRAAANSKSSRGKDGGFIGGPGVAAGVAAAAGGVAAAGYAATQFLGGDDDEDSADDKADTEASEDKLAPPPDDSMDAFDDLGGGPGGGGGGGGGGRGFGGGGGGGFGGARMRGAERVAVADRPPARHAGSQPDGDGDLPPLADISDARAELLDRFAAWEPPEGADADEVAAFRTDMQALIDRFQPRPGQSANDALAELRQEFDDQVEDFVQDMKLAAVIDEQTRDNGDDSTAPDIHDARTEMLAHLDGWPPPAGATPDEVAAFRTEMQALINDYQPRPGQSANDALAELRQAYDHQVQDFVRDNAPPPDPLPPTQTGFEWIPNHVDEQGQNIPGHWERERVTPVHDRPGLDWVDEHVDEYGRTVPAHWEAERPEPTPDPTPDPDYQWVEGRYDDDGHYIRGHWDDGDDPDPAVTLPPPSSHWVETHTEDGREIPGHWEPIPDPPPPPDVPMSEQTTQWVDGHFDEHGQYIRGHWTITDPGGTHDYEPPAAPSRTWVEGHYDDGHYVRGHWDEAPSSPGSADPAGDVGDADDRVVVIDDGWESPYHPPTTVPPPTGQQSDWRWGTPAPGSQPPTAPPVGSTPPPAAPPPQPYPDPIVRDHRGEDPTGTRPVVRDHRGEGDAGGGVVVRDHRARAAVADQQPGPEAAAGHMLPQQLEDVFDQVLPPGGPQMQPMMAGGDASSSPADEAAPPPPPAAEDVPSEPAPVPAPDASVDPGTATAPPEPVEPVDPGAAAPSDDLLGVDAFADASAAAPDLQLAAEIPAPAPAPEPEPEAVPVPAPEPVAAPEPAPVVAIADPVPADVSSDFGTTDTALPDHDGPDNDDAPSDLDTDPHTPL